MKTRTYVVILSHIEHRNGTGQRPKGQKKARSKGEGGVHGEAHR